MIVDILLWLFFLIWVAAWLAAFYRLAMMSQVEHHLWMKSGGKFRYGMIDVFGIAALIGIFIRYW